MSSPWQRMFQMQEEESFLKTLSGVQIKSEVVGLATLNVFQGKIFMKWKKQSSNMTLILQSFK